MKITRPIINTLLDAMSMRRPLVGELFLLGLRGASCSTQRTATAALEIEQRETPLINHYHDLMLVIRDNTITAFQYSAGPGDYYIKCGGAAGDGKGVAILLNGCWRYKRGIHAPHPPGYPALVQADGVMILRDGDRDGVQDDNEPHQWGWFGINIHKGGYAPANDKDGAKVGPNSAGCQVILDVEGRAWMEFKTLVYAAGNSTYDYTLIDTNWMERALGEEKARFMIRGSMDNRVKALQNKLAIPQTGIYDNLTMMAVRKFQRDAGVTPNGCAGPTTCGLLKI